MLKIIAKILFTKFVIALIVLPIPPSTIVGIAIIANPKTNQFLEPNMMSVFNWKVSMLKKAGAALMAGQQSSVNKMVM